MASTSTRKRTRSRAAPSRRRVADLTTEELREMLDQVIEQKPSGPICFGAREQPVSTNYVLVETTALLVCWTGLALAQ